MIFHYLPPWSIVWDTRQASHQTIRAVRAGPSCQGWIGRSEKPNSAFPLWKLKSLTTTQSDCQASQFTHIIAKLSKMQSCSLYILRQRENCQKCRQFLTYKLARELNVVRYVRYAGLIPDSFPPPVRAALAAVREGWNKVIKQVWAGPGRIRQDLYDSSAFQNSAYFSLPRSLALKPEKLATYSHSLQIYTLHTALHRSPS